MYVWVECAHVCLTYIDIFSPLPLVIDTIEKTRKLSAVEANAYLSHSFNRNAVASE